MHVFFTGGEGFLVSGRDRYRKQEAGEGGGRAGVEVWDRHTWEAERADRT